MVSALIYFECVLTFFGLLTLIKTVIVINRFDDNAYLIGECEVRSVINLVNFIGFDGVLGKLRLPLWAQVSESEK